jgi:hypothetical protein
MEPRVRVASTRLILDDNTDPMPTLEVIAQGSGTVEGSPFVCIGEEVFHQVPPQA